MNSCLIRVIRTTIHGLYNPITLTLSVLNVNNNGHYILLSPTKRTIIIPSYVYHAVVKYLSKPTQKSV